MKTEYFDGRLIRFDPCLEKKRNVFLRHDNVAIPVHITILTKPERKKRDFLFIQVKYDREIQFKWKDSFEIMDKGGIKILAEGEVLNPRSKKINPRDSEKMAEYLESLAGDEENMLLTLAQEKGIKGLGEKEMTDFSGLSRKALLLFSQQLEEKGIVLIFSFDPLFIFSRDCFVFLCDNLLSYVENFHKRYPQETGATFENAQKRFQLPARVLTLAVEYLVKEAKVRKSDDRIALVSFKIKLSPEEEKILKEMEKMSLKGEFQFVSVEELQGRFNLSAKRVKQLLSILVERKKIVQGQQGFILHSIWLDETIKKLKNLKKNELSVSEFKKMTGLSRKYAIPLLELLDQMGVTRRKGPVREIL